MNTTMSLAGPVDAGVARYQPLFEIAQAYQALQSTVAAELEECFTGNRNYAEYLDTARKIVHTTAPDALALILARLIAVTTDTTDIGDTEAATATAPEVTPQPLIHQIRTSLNAIPVELRAEFLAIQTRDIDLAAIADMAQRVTAQLAPCDMWRVLAGQLLVTAADNQMLRARFAATQHHTTTRKEN